MLDIDGMLMETSVYEIIQGLKLELSLRHIELLHDIKPTGDNIMVTCPMHKGGQERKPSCGIHVETGVVHCFTCGFSCSLPTFIGICLGADEGSQYIIGIDWLKRNYVSYEIDERPDIKLDMGRGGKPHKCTQYVPESVLRNYRYYHEYMYKRKLTDDVINRFDIGYDAETDCITFPVRDRQGQCLFVARRSVKGKYFNYPSGVEKPLYGLYELEQLRDIKEIIICESMLNCLTCWTHGLPAIALNGTGSKEQLVELNNLPYRSYVLCLDPDDAGRAGMKRIKSACGRKLLYTVKYKDDRDINDLDSEEFDELMKTKHLF